MLKQIVLNTPLWVWAILIFLIYRGVCAAVDREIAINRVFIVPLVMLGVSVHGIGSTFGNGRAAAAWLLSAAIVATLSWRLLRHQKIIAYPERSTVFLAGSWVPLALMLGIFFTKYAIAVTLVLSPAYRQQTEFVIAICVLYGIFNGVFIGNLLRVILIYRQTKSRPGKILFESSGKWGSQKS